MAELGGLDWPGYFRSLDDDNARALAVWLAAEGLQLGEFMELVDRAYAAAAADAWQGRARAFVTQIGQPTADVYALRKRRFAGLVAVLDEALISGALPGEVAPQELRPPVQNWTPLRSPQELASALERARHGQR